MVSINELMKNAPSSDPAVQLGAVQKARKLLSSDKNPPIDQIIEAGMLSGVARVRRRMQFASPCS
jgi:hypothetical protein